MLQNKNIKKIHNAVFMQCCCYTVFFYLNFWYTQYCTEVIAIRVNQRKFHCQLVLLNSLNLNVYFFLFCFGCLLALCNVHFISMNLSRSDHAAGRWIRGIRTADNEKLLHLLLKANRIEKLSVELIFNCLHTHNFPVLSKYWKLFRIFKWIAFRIFWEFNENVWFKLIRLSLSLFPI